MKCTFGNNWKTSWGSKGKRQIEVVKLEVDNEPVSICWEHENMTIFNMANLSLMSGKHFVVFIEGSVIIALWTGLYI